jgi:hypothetical protein
MFDAKYHGHGDATLVVLEDGEVGPESTVSSPTC